MRLAAQGNSLVALMDTGRSARAEVQRSASIAQREPIGTAFGFWIGTFLVIAEDGPVGSAKEDKNPSVMGSGLSTGNKKLPESELQTAHESR